MNGTGVKIKTKVTAAIFSALRAVKLNQLFFTQFHWDKRGADSCFPSFFLRHTHSHIATPKLAEPS